MILKEDVIFENVIIIKIIMINLLFQHQPGHSIGNGVCLLRAADAAVGEEHGQNWQLCTDD